MALKLKTQLTFLQRTSVPALPRLLSGRRMMEAWLSSRSHVPWASLNAGQPVPESYLASELSTGEGTFYQWVFINIYHKCGWSESPWNTVAEIAVYSVHCNLTFQINIHIYTEIKYKKCIKCFICSWAQSVTWRVERHSRHSGTFPLRNGWGKSH